VTFGFAGMPLDLESGLYCTHFRCYDPTTGRWTTSDPIGFGGADTNFYRYAGNRPLLYTDPSGLACEDILGKVFSGVTGTDNSGQTVGRIVAAAAGTAAGAAPGAAAGAVVGGVMGTAVGALGGPAAAAGLGVLGAEVGAAGGAALGGLAGGAVAGAVGSAIGGAFDSSPSNVISPNETPYVAPPSAPHFPPLNTMPYINPAAGRPQVGPAMPNRN
jgi:RHS repeat-associated protein